MGFTLPFDGTTQRTNLASDYIRHSPHAGEAENGEDSKQMADTKVDDFDSSGWSLSSSGEAGRANDQDVSVFKQQGIFSQFKYQVDLQDILDSIDFTISALFKILIRKPTRMGHTKEPGINQWPESAAYEFFDIQYVTDVCREADPRLQNRLGKLITQRRRALRDRRPSLLRLRGIVSEFAATPFHM